MPAVATDGATFTTGHGCDATATLVALSTNVFINGVRVLTAGASSEHTIDRQEQLVVGTPPNTSPVWANPPTNTIPVLVTICDTSHTVTFGAGSNKVFVNGRRIARVGDACEGGVIITGSSKVFAN